MITPFVKAVIHAWKKQPIIISVIAVTAIGYIIGHHYSYKFLGAGLGVVVGIWLGALIAEELNPVRLNDGNHVTDKNQIDALNSYIAGKMDRYKLLFAINGGAFAVAQFLLKDEGIRYRAVLPISDLAQGCIIFTAIMAADLCLFAQMMRRKYVGDDAFTIAGKSILLMITALIMGGWFIVLRCCP